MPLLRSEQDLRDAEGPISDPKELPGALKRGIERVKKGEPVLFDVVTQPR